MTARAPRTRDETGTSTLELVGFLPIAVVVVLGLLHAGVAAYGATATQTAARQAARAASLDQDPYLAARRALPGFLSPRVSTFGPGHGVRVTVNLPDIVPGTDMRVTRTAVLP